jgi:ABC-type multidrug transport system permease subunit
MSSKYPPSGLLWCILTSCDSPATYWIGGVLSATLHNIPVRCDTSETAIFDAPPGQTCSSYASSFLSSAPGYLLNPDATQGCQYCPYSVGDDYLSTLNLKASDKWRNFGIFLAFCVSNWALVYFFIWSVRIKGWDFGFGSVGKGVNKVKSLIGGKGKKGSKEKA